MEEIELTESQLLDAIKEAGIDKPFQAYLQKYTDQKVSSGIDTFKKNTQAKNLTDSEKITNLENELKELKNGNLKNSLENSIKASLKEAGLSEGFLKYIKVDKIEDIGSAIKDLNDNILGLKQEAIDKKLKEGDTPLKGDTTLPGTSINTAIKAYAEKISVKEK